MQPVVQRSPATPAGSGTTPQTGRIASIDIFRGLTILVMIFVNDVSGVRGLPWWTYHLPTEVNGMTYVDMVFPTFLFIVGVSIPLALERRIARGDSTLALWGHVALRSLSLLTLGLVLANLGQVNAAFTGMSQTTWRLLAFVAILLLWNVYPRSERYKWLFRAARCAGLVLLAFLLLVFRRQAQGHAAGLDFSYWEILGLIGWAYLSTCVLYLLLRRRPWAIVAALAGLSAMNVLCAARWLRWPATLPDYLWPFGTGALPSIVMAGVVACMILVQEKFVTAWRSRVRVIAVFAAMLFVAGYALTPLGISKNRATPTWCLYSSAAAAVLFLALYWLADVKRVTRWASFVKPAGSNTLLTYLLPWIWYSIKPLGNLSGGWNAGVPGVFKALCFTGIMLGSSALLTRLKFRLQL
jgi:heparan-alpha-glucosaminide N-acetyltransferase